MTVTHTHRDADGEEVFVEIGAVPVFDEAGEVVRMIESCRDITERKRAEEQPLGHQEQLQSLALELSSAEDRERRRVAEDIHDQVGQSLAALGMNLQMLRRAGLSEDHADALDQSLALVKQMSSDIRALTFELCPPMLYETGLAPAVTWLVDQFGRKHPADFQFEDDGRAELMGDELRGLLFRAVRELLVNATKHASARRVKVSMEKADGYLEVRVEDDGIGFDPSRIGSPGRRGAGFGLFSIRERLSHLGGRLEVRSDPGRGSCLTLVVPLDR